MFAIGQRVKVQSLVAPALILPQDAKGTIVDIRPGRMPYEVLMDEAPGIHMKSICFHASELTVIDES